MNTLNRFLIIFRMWPNWPCTGYQCYNCH